MTKCPVCGAGLSLRELQCPVCQWAPEHIDGFAAFSPALAHGGGGFKPDYFANLVKLEEGNFWFRARNRLILWALARYCADFTNLLEIGCGTGYVLSGIASRYPQAQLFASEIFTAGLGHAASRVPTATMMQMDARNIPFAEAFDVIGAFDVIEHIEEDDLVLRQMHAALRPGGTVLLTVPQHGWLWSPVDDYACHVRRYDARTLHSRIRAAGFRVVRSTSFVVSLLPAMWLSRIMQSRQTAADFDPSSEFNIPSAVNAALFQLLSAEIGLIRAGVDFPVGGSRLVVAVKEQR